MLGGKLLFQRWLGAARGAQPAAAGLSWRVLLRRAAVTRSGRLGPRRETLLPGGFASQALSQQFGVLCGRVPWLVGVSHHSNSHQSKRACPNKRSSAEAPRQAILKQVTCL